MAENLYVAGGSKQDKYDALIPQIKSILDSESDMIANMANVAAAIKETFGFFWVGFYRVSGAFLVLGPYQGPLACTRIKYASGVCGKAWEKRGTIIVPDVAEFPGHIACSENSKSEIVVPLFKGQILYGVLDIDSDKIGEFDEVDESNLQKIAGMLSDSISLRDIAK